MTTTAITATTTACTFKGYKFQDVDTFIQILMNIEKKKERDEWCFDTDIVEYIEKPKYLCFRPNKTRVCVDHYATPQKLSDEELDIHRKQLYMANEYELEDGEILMD